MDNATVYIIKTTSLSYTVRVLWTDNGWYSYHSVLGFSDHKTSPIEAVDNLFSKNNIKVFHPLEYEIMPIYSAILELEKIGYIAHRIQAPDNTQYLFVSVATEWYRVGKIINGYIKKEEVVLLLLQGIDQKGRSAASEDNLPNK